MKLYIKICLAVCAMIATYGAVVPLLISSDDWILFSLGVLMLFSVAPLTFVTWRKFK